MFTKFKVKVYLQAQLKLKFTAVQIYAKIVIGSFNIIYGPYHLWCKTVCNKKSFRKHRASCVGSKIGFRFLDQQSPKPWMRKVRTSSHHLLAEISAINGTWYT